MGLSSNMDGLDADKELDYAIFTEDIICSLIIAYVYIYNSSCSSQCTSLS